MTVQLNEHDKSVKTNGRTAYLTPKEWGIMKFLKNNPDTVFTAAEIYANVWQSEPFDCSGIIAVHLRHIREKIEADPSHPSLIKSLWGRGYRYCPNH